MLAEPTPLVSSRIRLKRAEKLNSVIMLCSEVYAGNTRTFLHFAFSKMEIRLSVIIVFNYRSLEEI